MLSSEIIMQTSSSEFHTNLNKIHAANREIVTGYMPYVQEMDLHWVKSVD